MSNCPTCGGEFADEVKFCPRDGSALQIGQSTPAMIGRVINQRYRILRLLGEGGWGQVYLAEHVRMGRRDAIKILNRSVSGSPDAASRFQREALNASRISHPNVVSIYDFGETSDHTLYIAMEYVEGETLSRLLKASGALPTARAIPIALQIADALAAAHEMGIVHRDLKPDNILIAQSRDGSDRAKVVDFGIAKATGESGQNITRTGFAVGTPGYMSPEQLIGDEVDGRSDLYSLACILYEMLTGEQPFIGPSTEMMVRRLTEPPPRVLQRNPRISHGLDDLVARAMAINPKDRFQTAAAFCDAVSTILNAGDDGVLRLRSWGRPQSSVGAGASTPPDDPARPPSPTVASPAQGDAGRSYAAGNRRIRRAALVAGGLAAAAVSIVAVLIMTSGTPPPDPALDADLASGQGFSEVAPTQGARSLSDSGAVIGLAESPLQVESTAEQPDPTTRAREAPELSTTPSRGGGQDEAPVPRDTPQREVERETEPRPTPPSSTLAGIRDLVQNATLMSERAEFTGAFGTLATVERQLVDLRSSYGEDASIQALLDEHAAALLRTRRACESLRMVRLLRNEPAPECR